MTIPQKLKIIDVAGPFASQKTGRPVFVVTAESPLSLPRSFSTLRWSYMTESKPAFGPGDEIAITPVSFDLRRGTGFFQPAN